MADGRRSCCKWGRANGWGMLSHIEVLAAVSGNKRAGFDRKFLLNSNLKFQS